ncbi:hypothetical protein, partial [Aeromonas jandaei]|uniref:hypothetical protein n=1 Tax=Aeromonas jandaei TaxID=650 RepID=UPI0012EB0DE4
MDRVTSFASGDEAVGAFFGRSTDKGKAVIAPEGSNKGNDAKNDNNDGNKKKKNKRKGQKAKRGADDDDDKEVLAGALEPKKPRGPPRWGCFRPDARGSLHLPQGPRKPQV